MKKFVQNFILLNFLFTCCSFFVSAQNAKVFTVEAFIQQVKQYHPAAKQANLLSEQATAGILSARGGFDPLFELNNSNKSLNGLQYYQYNNPEIQIPTGIGVNFRAGYEKSSGQFLNPELTNGVASYLGMEVPLLSGLLTDKKRTALRQAKIYHQQSEQDKLLIVNELLFNAYTAYWEWAGAYRLFEVYDNYLKLADKRSRLVSISFKQGDRSAADTIEAYAQLQNYRLLQSEALIALNKKAFTLSLFLWSGKGETSPLPPVYIPDTMQLLNLPIPADSMQLIAQARLTHPLIKSNKYKLGILKAEKKYKFQSLLPIVNLQANVLSKDYFQYKNISGNYLDNNYKLGVKVIVPLLFREGRGNYKYSKLKIEEASLELAKKSGEIENKIQQYTTEAGLLQKQLQVAYEMIKSYTDLLKYEELKFSQGESSLFLINFRENKKIETEQKVIELQVKYLKTYSAVQWVSGTIN